MKARILVLLIALAIAVSATASAVGTPTTGDVILRLRDYQQRPIINATVTFEYTLTDPVIGELHRTDVQYSNQFGVLEKRLIADFNTPYKITIAYHNAKEVIESSWTGGFDRYINLPLSDFSIRVIDSQGTAIAGVPLRVEATNGANFSTEVNSSGYKIFYQYNRDAVYTVFAKYGGVETPVRVVPDGQLHTIQIATYSIEVRTTDENSSMLVTETTATYYAINETSKSSRGVTSLFTQIPEGNVTISIRYNDRVILDTVYLNESITKKYAFDLSPPVIGVPHLTPEKPVAENEVIVTVTITDPGVNASGMPPPINMIPPAELYYSLDGVEWASAHMFPDADNQTYKARLTGFPRDSVVRYYIVAWDKMGNNVTSTRYSFNTFAGNGTNGHNGDNPLPDLFTVLFAYWWVIAVAVILAAAYYVKKKYF